MKYQNNGMVSHKPINENNNMKVIKRLLQIFGVMFLCIVTYNNIFVPQLPIEQSIQHEDWQLILVNAKQSLPKSYEVPVLELQGGFSVDERIYPDLQAMFDDARKNGLSPQINSAYRTPQEQKSLYTEKVQQYKSQGYSQKEAKELAAGWVALPGYSEHETGLALDIIGENGTSPDVQQWLHQNSYKYGFILRYPSGKEDITGINYEPWHFRYVGKEVATEIFYSQLTLEEYLEGLS